MTLWTTLTGRDKPKQGTHFDDTRLRISKALQQNGLLTIPRKLADGSTTWDTIAEVGANAAPEGAPSERYPVRVLNTRYLERILALGPQLAYELNQPSVTVKAEGNVVWVTVPRALAIGAVTYQGALALNPDIPAGLVLLGITTGEGEQMTVDLAGAPHCAVLGQTHSGKTTLVQTMILSAQMTGGVEVALLDPRREFRALSGHPSVWRHGNIESAADIEECLSTLVHQADAGREDDAKPLYIFVDEGHALVYERPRIGAYLERLIKTGRHAGLHVVLLSQDATGRVGALVQNCPVRLVGAMGNAQRAAQAAGLGKTGAEKLSRPGEFVARGHGLVVPFIAAWPAEALAEWATRYPPRRGVMPAVTPKAVTPEPARATPRAQAVTVAQSAAPIDVTPGTPYRGDALPASVRHAIVTHWRKEGGPLPRRRIAALVGLNDIDNDKRERWLTESLGERWRG